MLRRRIGNRGAREGAAPLPSLSAVEAFQFAEHQTLTAIVNRNLAGFVFRTRTPCRVWC